MGNKTFPAPFFLCLKNRKLMGITAMDESQIERVWLRTTLMVKSTPAANIIFRFIPLNFGNHTRPASKNHIPGLRKAIERNWVISAPVNSYIWILDWTKNICSTAEITEPKNKARSNGLTFSFLSTIVAAIIK